MNNHGKCLVVAAAAVIIMEVFLSACKSSRDVVFVSNSSPKTVHKKFVEIEKLFSIDVTQISLFGKERNPGFDKVIDFDENGNMYILDGFEARISVFDKDGKFVKSFGKQGQGPQEFSNPGFLYIKNSNIHVLHEFTQIKILSLDGKYISQQTVQIENPLKFYGVGDDLYLLSGNTERTFTKLEFVLRRYEDDQFINSEKIFRYDYPPGLRGPYYDFIWQNWLLISKNGEFYFPEDNFNKYSLIKYNQSGKPLLKFSRKYELKEYSKEAKDRYYSIYGRQIQKGEKEFPKSPPVIRKMFQDYKNNIWVISGETYEDNLNPDYENTVDIFNDKGEWLYSFKSDIISRYCLYHAGRIYKVSPLNLDSFEQFIDVYRIKY